MSNPVGWFEIYVQDLNRAKKFYESLFDTRLNLLMPPTDELEMWSWNGDQNSYGTPGALVHLKKETPPKGLGTMVYFACDDCGVQEAKVPKLGGKVERKKMSIGEYGFISIVYDTEGNMIGLHSMK